MFKVPHKLSNYLENEKILVKSQIHFWNSFFVKDFVNDCRTTTDLKTHKKVIYDNVTNHTTLTLQENLPFRKQKSNIHY